MPNEKIIMNWPDFDPPPGATDEPIFDIDDEETEQAWLQAMREMKSNPTLRKEVVYLKPGERAPQGVQEKRGKRGGRYYEAQGRKPGHDEEGQPREGGEEEEDPRGQGEEQSPLQRQGAQEQAPPPAPEPEIDPNDPKVIAAAIRANWKEMSHEEKMAVGNIEAMPQQMEQNLSRMRTHEAEVAPLGQSQWGANAMQTIASNMYNRLHTYAARLPEDVTDKLDDQMAKMLSELQESNYPASGKAEDIDQYMSLCLDAMVYQEQQTWRRQLGDHGIRHIFDDIEMGRQMGGEIMETIGHVTKDNIAVMTAAAIFHDIGYTADAARLTIEGTKYHQHYGAEYVKQNRETFDNMFGVESTEKIIDMIERHQDSDIDWQEDPMGTSLRVSDNLGLFAPEKLPALFNYIPGALDKLEEIHEGFLGGDNALIDEHKNDLRELVEMSSLNENIKQDLMAAVDEVFPMSGKFTLGMMAGEKLTPSFDGHTMHVPIRYSPEMKRLQQMFNIGQDAFKKLCDSYNTPEEAFQKGEVRLEGNGGALHIKVVDIPEEDQRMLWNSLLKGIARQEQKHSPHLTGTDQKVHGNWRGGRIAQAVAKHGGFTLDGTSMRPKTKGLMASLEDYEKKIPLDRWKKMSYNARAKIVNEYWRQYAEMLQKDPGDYSLGLWADEETGNVYFDINRSFDENDHKAVRQFARRNKQLAYFDLGTFTEHRWDEGSKRWTTG